MTPAEHTAAMKAGDITHKKADVVMYRSNYGSGFFRIVQVTEFGKVTYFYQIHPDKKEFKIVDKKTHKPIEKWIAGPKFFTTSQDAIDDAHERYGVFLKQHKQSGKE